MSLLEDAMNKVLFAENPVLIKCSDKKNQESTRIMLYHLKKRVSLANKQAEAIGITKLSTPENELFVKLFKRPKRELYEYDKDGNIVLMKIDPLDDPELQQIIELMRKDSKDEKEIQETINTWNDPEPEPKEESKSEILDTSRSNRNLEKAEMKKLLEGKKDEDEVD